MMLSFTICVFAEGTEAEQIVEETSNKLTQILGISGTVGIGTIIVAVIAVFLSNFKKIQTVVNSMASVFKNIFSKDGNIENVPQAFSEIKSEVKDLTVSFEEKLKEVENALKDDQTKQDQVMQILLIFIMNCTNVNQYAKSEMIQLITGSKNFGENAAESIRKIAESIAIAKENEEKTETPYLDKITSEVGKEG